MPGGLINIAVYGSQDLFLTGTPEITHFKVVYRRYTNFSVESKVINFETTVGFGLESDVLLPRVGDLISKTYLEIIVPEIKFKRTLDSSTITAAQTAYNDTLADMNTVGDFMSLNFEAYRGAYNEFLAVNDTTITAMKNKILAEFNVTSVGNVQDDVNYNIIQNFKNLITGKFDINSVNLNDIAQNISDSLTKTEFMNIINRAVQYSYTISKYFEDRVGAAYNIYLDTKNDNYKFAWVKKLGHSIIDYVDVFIGGDKIDRHYGQWIDIWYELAGNKNQQEIYDKLIGSVPELYTFDRSTKPRYVLQIPLQFWFCKYYGLAIPYVAMEYSDVTITVKLRKFEEVAYIENVSGINNIADLFENNGYSLQANLLVDYVYLDGPERRKFAMSGHEYLIEQMQDVIIEEISKDNIAVKLDFTNPCKDLIWVFQQLKFRQNYDNYTECKWWNYGVNIDGSKNICKTARLDFNGYSRIELQDGNYFNYAVPYDRGYNTPADGINIYSFSIHPRENQPSGSCNFTKISNAMLYLQVYPELFLNNGVITLHVYSTNYNVLRIIGGYGAIAFS